MTLRILTDQFPYTSEPHLIGAEKTHDIYRSILNDELGLEKLDKFSERGRHVKDFIRTCLQRTAARRKSAQVLLNHPWLDQVNSEEIKENELIEAG